MKHNYFRGIGLLALLGCAPTPPVPAPDPRALVIDVRSAPEYDSGHVAGAVRIEHTRITADPSALPQDKNAPILLYCRSGNRANLAMEALKAAGYTNVRNLGGVKDAARTTGREVVTEPQPGS